MEPPALQNDAVASLARQLAASVESCARGVARLSVLFSGGVDSSLVARLAAASAEVHLVVVGIVDSPDVRAAREGADLLGAAIAIRRLERPDVREVLSDWRAELRGIPEPSLSVLVTELLAIQACRDRRILCGQGADELFYGYAHYRGLDPDSARRRAAADWKRLVEHDWPLARRFAAQLGHDLRSPFLDESIAVIAHRLDPPTGSADGTTKIGLRAAARTLGLPEPLAMRPKKAMQYGSGVQPLVRAILASEGAAMGYGRAEPAR